LEGAAIFLLAGTLAADTLLAGTLDAVTLGITRLYAAASPPMPQ
jgi:hypothetical protein